MEIGAAWDRIGKADAHLAVCIDDPSLKRPIRARAGQTLRPMSRRAVAVRGEGSRGGRHCPSFRRLIAPNCR
ncbi:DUF736 family protein [Mesorhizobium sp. M0968]|uniref:DUF736 family protein n=1 Tax=Mesorhizobium sp. M0968 TaxID=2957037 RepID=UPI003335502D